MSTDNRPLDERLDEAEKILATWYRFGGTSPEVDINLWFLARDYCVKHSLPEPAEFKYVKP